MPQNARLRHQVASLRAERNEAQHEKRLLKAELKAVKKSARLREYTLRKKINQTIRRKNAYKQALIRYRGWLDTQSEEDEEEEDEDKMGEEEETEEETDVDGEGEKGEESREEEAEAGDGAKLAEEDDVDLADESDFEELPKGKRKQVDYSDDENVSSWSDKDGAEYYGPEYRAMNRMYDRHLYVNGLHKFRCEVRRLNRELREAEDILHRWDAETCSK